MHLRKAIRGDPRVPRALRPLGREPLPLRRPLRRLSRLHLLQHAGHATDAKDFLLQNMYEEELSDVRHTDLLIRFAEACGHDPRAGEDTTTPPR